MNPTVLSAEDDWNRHELKPLALSQTAHLSQLAQNSGAPPLLSTLATFWDCALKQEYETLLLEALLVLEASILPVRPVRLLRKGILEALQKLA